VSTVYILTNEAMPDWIKIGISDGRLDKRILELDNTSVPLPFSCFYAAQVADYKRVERILHQAFDDYRKRRNREFFYRLDPNKVKVILEAFAISEDEVHQTELADPELAKVLERATQRAGRYSFTENRIPTGSTLTFVKNINLQCTVISEFEVDFQGQVMSISKAAREACVVNGGQNYPVNGTLFWLYDGASLNAIRSARLDQVELEEN